MAAVNMWSQQYETTPLADTVADQASVTSDQAIGGIGSMLALAQNSLYTADNKELTTLIPGMSSLGMDPSMVSKLHQSYFKHYNRKALRVV